MSGIKVTIKMMKVTGIFVTYILGGKDFCKHSPLDCLGVFDCLQEAHTRPEDAKVCCLVAEAVPKFSRILLKIQKWVQEERWNRSFPKSRAFAAVVCHGLACIGKR